MRNNSFEAQETPGNDKPQARLASALLVLISLYQILVEAQVNWTDSSVLLELGEADLLKSDS